MKKGLKILCAALSLTAIMSFSAFAAETRKEYRAEAEPIRTEMKAMEEQMDALRESNKNSMEHFKNIHLNKKETGELPVDKSVWKEAKTLREENGDSQVKNLRAEAKAAAENKDFDTAILKLKEAEKEKEKRLEMLKEINSIWKQIDDLLSSGQ
jgi:predicted RNase H-like nuclease (RuvC/YqgF family)